MNATPRRTRMAGEAGQAITEYVTLSAVLFLAGLAAFNAFVGPLQSILGSVATRYLGVVAGTP